MARHPYDEASDIIAQQFPAMGRANTIMRETFPASAAADRTLADAGLIPKRGRGGLTAGTAGGISPTIGRWPGREGAVSGPRRTGPRPPLARVIMDDALRGQQRGYTVHIQTWAGLMQSNGVAGETIFAAYEAAGGSPVLSAAQQRGDTSDFLGDFVEALEDLGVDPAIIAGTYQQAGGRIGDVDDSGAGGGRGGRGHGGPGGFLGDVTRGAGRAAAGAAGAVQDAVDQAKKLLGF